MSDVARFVDAAKGNPAAVHAALKDSPQQLVEYLQQQFPEEVITLPLAEQVASVAGLDTKPHIPQDKEPGRGFKIIYLIPPDAVYKDQDLFGYLRSDDASEGIQLASIQDVKPQEWRQIVRGTKEEVQSRGARSLLRPVPKCSVEGCGWFALQPRGIPHHKRVLCSVHRLYGAAKWDLERSLRTLMNRLELVQTFQQNLEEWRWWFVANSSLANQDASSTLNLPDGITTLLENYWLERPSVGSLIEKLRSNEVTEVPGIKAERLQLIRQALEQYIAGVAVPPLSDDIVDQIFKYGQILTW